MVLDSLQVVVDVFEVVVEIFEVVVGGFRSFLVLVLTGYYMAVRECEFYLRVSKANE